MHFKKSPLFVFTGLAFISVFAACLYFLVQTGQPSADVRFKMQELEYVADISNFAAGDVQQIEVYGVPVVIWKRNADDMRLARKQNNQDDWRNKLSHVTGLTAPILADDDQLTIGNEWLVVWPVNWGHWGCVVLPRAGDFGGFFDPCHGSHFDMSGRVEKGPSTRNLKVISTELDAPEGVLILDLTGLPGMVRSWQD